MRLTINCETTLSFDIEAEDDDQKITAILYRDGGTWFLTGDQPWIGNSRLDWPEALKRALIRLTDKPRKPQDGVAK